MTTEVVVYPRGAIQRVEELHPLVTRALSGERVVIFWTVEGSSRIQQLQVLSWSELDCSMLIALDKGGKRMSLFPYLRSVAGCGGHGPRYNGEYWFTNYWHAYAYSLKGKKHD